VASLPAAEIKALASILDELDYYQVLDLPRDAPLSGVKRAYHATSRRFHPDAHRTSHGEVRWAVGRIAKRVTEAYSVLRDPRRRRVYDEQLESPSRAVRLQLAQAEAAAGKQAAEERTGATPNGRRFFTMAQSDMARGNLDAAVRNLQMAVTFEPGNRFFKEKLAELRNARR
jgi:DnaJ-class molecular chaperone